MGSRNLSACELTAMKCIWDMGAAAAGRIAGKLVREYGLECNEASVQLFLGKLLRTGFVHACGGLDVYYVPAITEKEFRQEQQKKVLKLWLSGRMGRFVSGL